MRFCKVSIFFHSDRIHNRGIFFQICNLINYVNNKRQKLNFRKPLALYLCAYTLKTWQSIFGDPSSTAQSIIKDGFWFFRSSWSFIICLCKRNTSSPIITLGKTVWVCQFFFRWKKSSLSNIFYQKLIYWIFRYRLLFHIFFQYSLG